MNDGTRSIGFWTIVIIALTLLAALYGITDIVYHQIRMRKRRKVLSYLISEGQRLQNAIPSGRSLEALTPWTQAVNAWIRQTTSILQTYSSQAAESFNNVSLSSSAVGSGISALLQIRLDNLRSISERPDLYYY